MIILKFRCDYDAVTLPYVSETQRQGARMAAGEEKVDQLVAITGADRCLIII